MTRRRRGVTGRARCRTPLIVAASLGLHAVVLGPLALGSLGIRIDPTWTGPHPYPLLPMDVLLVRKPSLPGEPSRGRTPLVVPPTGTFIPTPVAEIGSSDTEARFRAGPVLVPRIRNPATRDPSDGAPTPASDPDGGTGQIDGISEPWRLRPGQSTTTSSGTAPLVCRRIELLPPIEREICEARLAAASSTRVGQRRLSRTESAREDGFAEQAAANAAWAAYRRSEDDGQSYPGLRSMLKHF